VNRTIRLRVNGEPHERDVEPRTTLTEFIREQLDLTGTHVGCEHGVCGACTVLLDGEPVRSCLIFAIQTDGAEILTVEGLADGEHLHPIQQAFWDRHGLQCGFCTPGMLLTVKAFLAENPTPTDDEIREAIGGNLCRCTGYHGIVESIRAAAGLPAPRPSH
jgi:aerobic-type carbon monoxide dehydrogenase small subunit (CoxS/CutS family)